MTSQFVPSYVIWVTRVSPPLRTKEWFTSSEPMNLELASEVAIRDQEYSSIRMRAFWIGSWLPTNQRARWMPNCSADSMPYSLAKAYTVFLVVSVGRTLAFEPE